MVAVRYRTVSAKIKNWWYILSYPKFELYSMDMSGKIDVIQRFDSIKDAEADVSWMTLHEIHKQERDKSHEFKDYKTYHTRRMSNREILQERDNERENKRTLVPNG